MRALILTALVVGLLLAAAGARAETTDAFWYGKDEAGEPTVRLYVFWSTTCPHCRQALPFIRGLDEELSWLEVRPFLLTDRPQNVDLYLLLTRHFGRVAPGVPTFAFCERLEVGYADEATTGVYLREQLLGCWNRLTAGAEAPAEEVALAPVNVPVLGPVDAKALSLPVFTVLIAGLDAFNPCAFFVLMFLLSFVAHARDRKRMAVIGVIFVTTSGIVYFLFITAWLNAFLWAGELRWVTTIAALVAILFAVINIKDFVAFRQGPSLTIPKSAKAGLFARMRSLTATTSWPALLLGAVVLAIAANSYELLCTSGFPMIFSRILTLHGLSTIQYYGYLVLYSVVYVLPLLGLATVFVVTMGSRKLQEAEGRMLKLLSGLMMLGLGSVLLFEPDLLSNPWVAAGLLGASIVLTAAATAIKHVHEATTPPAKRP